MTNILEANAICKYLRNSALCFLLIISVATFSQNQTSKKSSDIESLPNNLSKDALFKATKDLIANKEYKNAAKLMRKHYSKYSENLEINWLYAHVFWLNKKEAKAKKKFEKAYSIDSNNRELQLDYARFLYQHGKNYQLASFLKKSKNDNNTNAEYLLMQANSNFWKGDLKSAREKIARVKEIYPSTDATKKLEQEIADLTAGYINTNFEYQTDSQPMEYLGTHLRVGEYVNRYLNPQLEVSRYRFTPQKEGALIVNLKNQFYFDRIKMTANVHGGAYINQSGENDWIGGVNLNKKILQNASLKVGYEKSPVLTTIASTTFNLTQQTGSASLDYKNKYVELNAGFLHSFFDDGNYINTISSWILSKPFKVYKFSFQIGYGYNYTDAKDILFIYDSNGVGIYDPYFTPEEQEIHSGLFVLNYKPTEKLSLKGKLNYGIQATVQNPYPLLVAANTYEIGGFYNAPFDYTEIEGSINYQVSKKFTVNANYIYQETFFYDRQNFNLGLNFIF